MAIFIPIPPNQRAYGRLSAFRAAFDAAIAQKIDLFVKENAIPDLTVVPYRDDTTVRLDEALQRIQES